MLMSIKEYAQYKGWSLSYVYRLIKQGRITVTKHKIDRDAADAQIDGKGSCADDLACLDIPVNANTAELITVYNRARALLTAAKAELAKLELERAQGKNLDGDEVRRTAFNTGKRVRDAMERIPDRISPQLAAMTDVVAIRNMLREEIRKALTELKNELMEGLQHEET